MAFARLHPPRSRPSHVQATAVPSRISRVWRPDTMAVVRHCWHASLWYLLRFPKEVERCLHFPLSRHAKGPFNLHDLIDRHGVLGDLKASL
jgi:hypothetical protein